MNFGSGTDPIEGASLAISILTHLYNNKTTVVSTTHYQELKKYCLVTPGFINASCEFNVEELKPTYKLLIGIPGKSNAFAISKKLGLNENILSYASSLVTDENINIEELLKSIYDDKIEIEKQKEETLKNLNQVELLKNSLTRDNDEITRKQDDILSKAKLQARQLILDAKEQAAKTIKQVKKVDSNLQELLKDDIDNINNLRHKLNEDIKETKTSSGLNLDVLKSLNTRDQMKKNTRQENKKNTSSNISFQRQIVKSQNISSEINLIGTNVDDAIFILEKYIDDCVLSKLDTIRIVHGKGTGKLRTGLHTYLKNNKFIKNYRVGSIGEGDMGVTIANLK